MNVNLTTSALVSNRDKIMYAKPLVFYRGVTNTVKFQFKNNDQKKVKIHDKIITFNIIDLTTYSTQLTRTMTIEDGNNGIAKLVISSSDLQDIKSQHYTWSVKVVDGENNEHIGYVDDNYGAKGELRVQDGVFPDFVESKSVTFTGGNTSSAINANPQLNNNAGLHTAQFYFSAPYTGTLVVQGTMDDTSNQESINWFDIKSITYTGQSNTTYTTWNGVYAGVRFKKTDTSGTISSVLYRY